MTSYNRNYGIPQQRKEPAPGKHMPYGRELNPMEQELLKRVAEGKQARQQVIAKAQALEREAAREKAKRERAAAKSYEYEPA